MEKENFLQKIKRIWIRLGNSDIDVNNERRLSNSELAELANIKAKEEEIRNGGSRARGFVARASVDEKKAGRTATKNRKNSSKSIRKQII